MSARNAFFMGWRVPSIVFLLLLTSACSQARYRTYTERCGLFDCLDENSKSAQESFLPNEVEPVAPLSGRTAKKVKEVARRQLAWPLRFPVVTSRFGTRSGSPHDGIDLRATVGTPIYSAHEGRVLYTGQKISGYGKMVVVKHPKEFSTIYAHQSRIKVRVGQWVKRGQLIGFTGATGNVSGPHLHFEVRIGTVPVDPVLVLRTENSSRGSRKMASRR